MCRQHDLKVWSELSGRLLSRVLAGVTSCCLSDSPGPPVFPPLGAPFGVVRPKWVQNTALL